jgi:hypothetical protein
MKLRNHISVDRVSIDWANALVTERHYLHRPVHPRAHPFAYVVKRDGIPIGTIIMATPHFTRQRGLFGYPGLPTKWQILMVSRVWLDPSVQGRQANGHASNVASCALGSVMRTVQFDWLEHHPPIYPDEPYHICLVMAYADTSIGHEGTIYKAANFTLWGETINSRRRHTTRGEDNGARKLIYIYRLPKPQFEPCIQLRLPKMAVNGD